jgi:serine phosphatase RsbU (regulator of sigma subunit)
VQPHHDQNAVTVVGNTVTRTVRDIAHVIPPWAKALIAALAALLALAAALILLGAIRTRRLRAQRAALLADVGALQAALLPVVPPRVGALAVSVAYRPAAGLAAGGDFYDVFPLEGGRVGVIVGDVSGHGRESIRSATFTRHMVRSYLEAGLAPRNALQLAGRVVDEHDRDDFATVIAGIHDPDAGTLSYASAGHPPAIVQGPIEHVPLIVASAPPIGVGNPTGLRQTTIPFPPGSSICLFTDGLFEGRSGSGMFGRARLDRVVRELGPDATAEEVVERVVHDADAIRDDIAVCMIRVEDGAAGASTVRVEELEVDASEVDGPRVRRFLTACGVEPGEIDGILRSARARAAKDGSVVLRVRLAADRSGVDLLRPLSESSGTPVALLRPARANSA